MELHRKIKLLNKQFPSCLILAGLLTSVISLIVFSNNLLISCAVILICSGVLLSLSTFRIFGKFFFWALIGIAVCWSHFNFPVFSKSSGEKLFEGNRVVSGVVADYRAVGNDISWLDNPKSIKIKVKKYRIRSDNDWISCNKTVNAKIKNCSFLKYGDKVVLSGYISIPKQPLIEGAFNYKNYLKSKGINYQFYGKLLRMDRQEKTGFSVKLYEVRNQLIKNLAGGIKNLEIKTFLAGIVFGCRQSIPENLKNNFIKNGVAHILAISGLHVGIFAVFLLIILRFIPVRIRFLLIPFFLYLYVFLAGFQESAVRAAVMISVFCFFRVAYISDRPVNNIIFAAVILILANPLTVISAGFQFSFLITGILILSWKKCKEWKSAVFEKNNWLIPELSGKPGKIKIKLLNWVFSTSFTCIAAALASMGLVLYYQKLFIPLTPLLNFTVVPLMFPLVFISLIKIFTVSVFGNFLNIIFNATITSISNLIFNITESGTAFSPSISIGHIPWFLIASFYLLIILFIFLKKRTGKIICLIMLCCIIIYGAYKNSINTGLQYYILKAGGNTKQCFVQINPLNSSVCIIGLYGYSSYVLCNFLESVNIDNIDVIYLADTKKRTFKNAEILMDKMKVRQIKVNPSSRKSTYLKRFLKTYKSEKKNITYGNKFSTGAQQIVVSCSKNITVIKEPGTDFNLKTDRLGSHITEIISTENRKIIKLTNTDKTVIKKLNKLPPTNQRKLL
ncbi:MAG: competence protein ComEC family protein [Victivallales bacterium]|nr:competence protein ComEC family protein [Victivallales bacterium]MCF7889101.1 competence protein ComEC family protein [Victivallales bacterium]